MPAKYWICPRRCGGRWPRTAVKCRTVGCEGRRPKKAARAHARALRDYTYIDYLDTARLVHGVTDESCCACGRPRSQERHHDRDHDHLTGERRGILCGGNRGCNVLLVPWVTAATARGIATAKQDAAEPDAERWSLLASYLGRVEAHRAAQ